MLLQSAIELTFNGFATFYLKFLTIFECITVKGVFLKTIWKDAVLPNGTKVGSRLIR